MTIRTNRLFIVNCEGEEFIVVAAGAVQVEESVWFTSSSGFNFCAITNFSFIVITDRSDLTKLFENYLSDPDQYGMFKNTADSNGAAWEII